MSSSVSPGRNTFKKYSLEKQMVFQNRQMSFSVSSERDGVKQFILEKQKQIINKMNEKKNDAFAKIDYNVKRLFKIIPEEIQNMPAGQFLDKYSANYDEAFMLNIQKEMEKYVKPNTYQSPPHKSTKKIIRKAKN